MARPTTYTTDAGDEIVRRLSEGEPLAAICRDEGMPSVRAVSDWRKAHPEFGERFQLARDDGHDAIAARMRATARGDGPDKGGDSKGDVQRDKLIIDTDFKLLSKWDPRRYGERMTLAGDHDNPLFSASDEQINARIAELLAKQQGQGNA